MSKLLRLAIFGLVATTCVNASSELVTMLISGELRTRAYYQENIQDLSDSVDDNFGRIEQRVRLRHEAQMTDGVSVVITGEATGLWGSQNEGFSSGSAEGTGDIPEGYLSLQDIRNTDWSVKAGRQHMNFGRGFLISDNEKEISYDALLVTGEFPTWTISLAAARLDEAQTIEGLRGGMMVPDSNWNLYLADLNWHDENILPLSLGGYVIYAEDETALGREPLIFGVRGDYTTDIWSVWGEVAYETGDVGDQDLDAIAFDVGGSVSFESAWSPKLKVAYTFASGDEPSMEDFEGFQPLGQYRYFGHALSPTMSNVHIFNAGASVQPNDYWTFGIDYYHYMQDEEVAGIVGNPLLTDPGIMKSTTGLDDNLGDEVDVSATFHYTDGVKAQVLLAYFMPGDAYGADDDDALEIRGEILVSF
ncbi:MAG: alginate export family protein [bacterium]|nr:alginate export family protein [bacterium]